MKNKLLFTAILIAGLTFVSFGTTKVYGQTPKSNMAMKDTMKYTCAHHPEVVSNKPGKCPKCGMALVAMNKTSGGMKKGKMKDGMMHDMTKMKKDSTMMKKEIM
jgi:hypothetical protein